MQLDVDNEPILSKQIIPYSFAFPRVYHVFVHIVSLNAQVVLPDLVVVAVVSLLSSHYLICGQVVIRYW